MVCTMNDKFCHTSQSPSQHLIHNTVKFYFIDVNFKLTARKLLKLLNLNSLPASC